jgi:5-methylcytosine-specific restriction endonuclease McrA
VVSGIPLTYDHITPASRGGLTTWQDHFIWSLDGTKSKARPRSAGRPWWPLGDGARVLEHVGSTSRAAGSRPAGLNRSAAPSATVGCR